MSWWDNKNFLYKRMANRHKELYAFIKRFAEEKKIESVLEVGGGENPMSHLADNYLNVDINTSLSDTIHEDFTKMDLTSLAGKFDLVLALSVIEHCEGYEKFLKQVKKVRPKYNIISFFNKLSREENFLIKKNRYGGNIWVNKYSQQKLEEFLKQIGISNYNFVEISRDKVLIICFSR